MFKTCGFQNQATTNGAPIPAAAFDFTNAAQAFDSRITFARSSVATHRNSSFSLIQDAINVARGNANQDWSSAGMPLGLLLEESRQNLILNNTTMSTQSVTTAASQYTLSFFGTGTITLSGTSTAGPLVGTGANNLVQLTFTPAAGSLTLTVTGTVSYGQLELGAFATSRIINAGSANTRASDNASILTLPSIGYSQTQGAVMVEFGVEGLGSSGFPTAIAFDDGSANNAIVLFIADAADDTIRTEIITGGVSQGSVTGPIATANSTYKAAFSWANNSLRLAVNGTGYTEDTSISLPTVTRLLIGRGRGGGANWLNGWDRTLNYYPQQLSQSALNAMTA